MFTVPPDAGFRKKAANGLIAVGHYIKAGGIGKWQLNCPVVGQLHGSPATVIKFLRDGRALRFAGFGKYGSDAEIEIFFRVRGVAEMKLPIIVEVYMFSRAGR